MSAHADHQAMRRRAGGFRRSLFSRVAGFLFLSVVLVLFQNGCARPLTVPIETERLTGAEQPHHTLLIYLPGNADTDDAFKRKGLLSQLQEWNVPADIIGVNAHLGYYRNGSILERLKHDVIDPA